MGTGKFDSNTGKFNLTVNVDYQFGPAQLISDAQLTALWKPAFQKASELLYAATGGRHQLGVIQVCNSQNNLGNDVADVNLIVGTVGDSDAGGGWATLGPSPTIGRHMIIHNDISSRPTVIVHELGHFIYGLRNENKKQNGMAGLCLGHDLAGSPNSTACFMEAERADGGEFDPQHNQWIHPNLIHEFCSTIAPTIHTANNEQDNVNHESCWQTMQTGAVITTGSPRSPGYYDLQNVAPAPTGADQVDWVVLGTAQRFVLVIDRSGSMAGAKKIDEAKFGADWWVDAIPDGDNFALISFSDTASVDVGIGPITNRVAVKNTIDSLVARAQPQ